MFKAGIQSWQWITGDVTVQARYQSQSTGQVNHMMTKPALIIP